jgi:monoamine oxidase
LASAVEPSTDHDVVIVGAGAAGLYAAYELDNLGFDVLVLEATNRHGGRVFSSTLGTVRIEPGAEELYGPMNNFIYDDIVDLLGGDAQTPIFTGESTQDQLISLEPYCLKSLHEERPDLVEKCTQFLEAQFEAHQALAQQFTRSEDSPLTPEQLRSLRSLGYIQ